MCLTPIKINYSDNYKNYRGTLIHAYNNSQMLPCGKCLICKENKIEEWVNRWTEQMKITPENTSYFLTLTYSDENLTYITTPKGELTTLNYDDVQKFLKRLRKRQTKKLSWYSDTCIQYFTNVTMWKVFNLQRK